MKTIDRLKKESMKRLKLGKKSKIMYRLHIAIDSKVLMEEVLSNRQIEANLRIQDKRIKKLKRKEQSEEARVMRENLRMTTMSKEQLENVMMGIELGIMHDQFCTSKEEEGAHIRKTSEVMKKCTRKELMMEILQQVVK